MAAREIPLHSLEGVTGANLTKHYSTRDKLGLSMLRFEKTGVAEPQPKAHEWTKATSVFRQ